MKRLFICIGILLLTPMLMGADIDDRGTAIQREMTVFLNVTFGMQPLPKDLTEPGEEFSFQVTDEIMKNLKAYKRNATPIEIPSESDLATKKGEVLQEMGFIPRKEVVNEADPFLYDVTDLTLEKLDGKTITILRDGTVKTRLTP